MSANDKYTPTGKLNWTVVSLSGRELFTLPIGVCLRVSKKSTIPLIFANTRNWADARNNTTRDFIRITTSGFF